MLYNYTLNEIATNINTGIEYEIALFYKLLKSYPAEQSQVMNAINTRHDAQRVKEIIELTSTDTIEIALRNLGLTYTDVSFETQNDTVGPADVVLFVSDKSGNKTKIGLSIKYSNTCTLNVTGRKFIMDNQIASLKERYKKTYVPMYLDDMALRFGRASNWHRKNSEVTDKMIDEIRDAVIVNWPNVQDKTSLLNVLFHNNSPIEFWVVNYGKRGYALKTKPSTIDMNRANDVKVAKYQSSYIAFYLDNTRVGHMQVKFNNGFIEGNLNHKGERKKKQADFVRDGIEFNFGQPFGSWNFSVEE